MKGYISYIDYEKGNIIINGYNGRKAQDIFDELDNFYPDLKVGQIVKYKIKDWEPIFAPNDWASCIRPCDANGVISFIDFDTNTMIINGDDGKKAEYYSNEILDKNFKVGQTVNYDLMDLSINNLFPNSYVSYYACNVVSHDKFVLKKVRRVSYDIIEDDPEDDYEWSINECKQLFQLDYSSCAMPRFSVRVFTYRPSSSSKWLEYCGVEMWLDIYAGKIYIKNDLSYNDDKYKPMPDDMKIEITLGYSSCISSCGYNFSIESNVSDSKICIIMSPLEECNRAAMLVKYSAHLMSSSNITEKIEFQKINVEDEHDIDEDDENEEIYNNATCNNKSGQCKASSDPYECLNNLIGLESIKKDVSDLVNLMKMQQRRKSQGLNVVPVSLHLVFSGNPGTGKTTIARILADIYKDIGVLSKGQLVEVDRSGLVAGYVGQTAIKTQEKINEALGGILFIDEAYTLVKDGQDYGQEAIDTILKAMEDHRNDFIVIVAGYTDLMQKFINSNPGLKSRFNKYINFPDYSADELVEIFYSMCKEYQYKLSDEADKVMRERIYNMEANKNANFANARDVRNMFEAVITNQATRLASENASDIMEITEKDFR